MGGENLQRLPGFLGFSICPVQSLGEHCTPPVHCAGDVVPDLVELQLFKVFPSKCSERPAGFREEASSMASKGFAHAIHMSSLTYGRPVVQGAILRGIFLRTASKGIGLRKCLCTPIRLHVQTNPMATTDLLMRRNACYSLVSRWLEAAVCAEQ